MPQNRGSNSSILKYDQKNRKKHLLNHKVVNIFENKQKRFKMNMQSYKVELNRNFVPANQFYNENSEDLRVLK